MSFAETSAKGTGLSFWDGPESSAPQVFPYISALFEAELLLDDAHQLLGIGHGNAQHLADLAVGPELCHQAGNIQFPAGERQGPGASGPEGYLLPCAVP